MKVWGIIMTRIMICGSREESDIKLLVKAGVDAVGLITEVKQDLSCKLTREQARKLVDCIPPLVFSVLILTEERIDEVSRLVDYVHPQAVQLHGFNRPEEVAVLKARLPVKIIKTLHLQGDHLLEKGDPENIVAEYLMAGADAILLDSCDKDKVGSTGRLADLAMACQIRDRVSPRPFILAGGLHAGNVSEAVQKVQPFAVDVFSGVNRQGYIDPQMVKQFVNAVRFAK